MCCEVSSHPPTPSTSFLDRNAISRVEGLERCPHLEELYVSGQRLKRGVELTFDYASLETIGVSEFASAVAVTGDHLTACLTH